MIKEKISRGYIVSAFTCLVLIFVGCFEVLAEEGNYRKNGYVTIQELVKSDIDILLDDLSTKVRNINLQDLEVEVEIGDEELILFTEKFQKYAEVITDRIYKNSLILNSIESLFLKRDEKLFYSKHTEFLRREILEDVSLAKSVLNSSSVMTLIVLNHGQFDSDTDRLIATRKFAAKRADLLTLIKNSFSYKERIIGTYIKIVSGKIK